MPCKLVTKTPIFLILISLCCVLACCEKENKVALSQYHQWETVTLSFQGPETSETAEDNPFLNYRLIVDFIGIDTVYNVRGYYAADGNAANSGASSGKLWQVRFTPDRKGEWSYVARLEHGDSIAIKDSEYQGKPVHLLNANGKFQVIETDQNGSVFHRNGRLLPKHGYFQFAGSGDFFLKGGANSPENLLAYSGFDDTYRMRVDNREGESSVDSTIHTYAPHIKDWKTGDPLWKNSAGKGLIGAINYLASKGMNSVYFILMNIGGDGKDVWPYRDPYEFTRFDVSKLEQWEIVFNHMQTKGLLLHIVLQETENEMLLDHGNTGPMRRLYLNEMIARFGHHLALNWNLGEENGPAPFSPNGQNDAQRKEMTNYLKSKDPYQNTVLLHTHSSDPQRKVILDSILGFDALDGLSFQVDKRESVAEVIRSYKEASKKAGHEWIITMDEIGRYNIGAQTDAVDPDHDTLRRYVLWGSLLAGGGGVEWYFGGDTQQNDLNSEDWRMRDRLWELTDIALQFFKAYLPYWEMEPAQNLVGENNYCFAKAGEIYTIYYAEPGNYSIDLTETEKTFSLNWYDPLTGGSLQVGSVEEIQGGKIVDLGIPPTKTTTAPEKKDWVALLRSVE